MLGFTRTSLIAQLVKNPPAMQETLVRFLDQENPLEKGQVTTPHSRALLVAQLIKGSVCNAGDLGLTPGLGKSLEKGKATHSSILA